MWQFVICRACITAGHLHVCAQEEQTRASVSRAVAAFVTFREEAAKVACLRAQPRSRMRQWLTLKSEHKLRGR